MIYFYLNDGSVNRYNLNFELNKAENYGILINKLLLNITNYIYGVQKIILVKQEDVENIVEINLETDVEMLDKIDDSDKIVKILIYERERHENGNVKKCNLVDKYLEYERIRQDELFAQSIENESFSRRRYSIFRSLPTTNRRITNRIANVLYNSVNNTLQNNPDNTDTDTESWEEENVEPITDPVMSEPLISEISTDTIANTVANSLADTIVNTMNETIDETTNLINDLNDSLYNSYENLDDISLEDINDNPLSIIGNTISSRISSRYSNSINNIANTISDTIDDLLTSTDTSIDNAVFTGLFNGISTIYNSFTDDPDDTSEISNIDEPVNNIPVSPITVRDNNSHLPPPLPPPPLPPTISPTEEPIIISNSFGERDPITGFERVDGSIPRPPPLPPPLPPLIPSVRTPPPLPSRSRRPNIPMLPPGIRSVIRRTNTPNQERRNANLTENPLFINRSNRLNRAARIFADTYRSTQDFLESRVNMVAPEEEVDKFKIVTYSEIKNNDEYPKLTKCNITLEEFEDDCQVMILPCKHYYMIEPLKKWLLEHSNKCPMCRKECCKGKPSY